jgi:nitrogen fixation protein FixH
VSTNSPERAFNPWPYSIIGFFALAIVAAIIWVVFCIGHGTDLVAGDYYEQEVQYQMQIDRVEQARSLADEASIVYDAGAARIQIRLPREHALTPLQGTVHLYRPSEARLDQTFSLEVSDEGVQQIDTSRLKPGLWDVRLQWHSGGREFFVNQRVSIGPASS